MSGQIHPVFLPFSEDELLEHFIETSADAEQPRQRLERWQKRIADAPSKDPAFLHRDETLWTAGALLAVHRHPDHHERWRSLLAHLFGSVPPIPERLEWSDLLDGRLELFFEVGLSSPGAYRSWLGEHLRERQALLPQVTLGLTRGMALEGRTQLDALLLNRCTGFALHIEAKVLSDIDTKTTFDSLRNQLARNLDCMVAAAPTEGVLAARQPDRSFFALLTPELFRRNWRSRLYGHLLRMYRDDAAALQEDLPHLDGATCAGLARRIGWLAFEDLRGVAPEACPWLEGSGSDGSPEFTDEDIVGRAVHSAAETLQQLDRDGVAVRERALQQALAAHLPGGGLERQHFVPGWDPQPGRLDVFVQDGAEVLTHVIETKLKADDRIRESLWDFAKVLSLGRGDSRPAAYLVTGTTKEGWTRYAGAELFATGTHDLVAAIQRYREWWVRYILADSAGRPLEVPAEMHVDLVATVPMTLNHQEWELRAVRVTPGDEWTAFAGGLPIDPSRK